MGPCVEFVTAQSQFSIKRNETSIPLSALLSKAFYLWCHSVQNHQLLLPETTNFYWNDFFFLTRAQLFALQLQLILPALPLPVPSGASFPAAQSSLATGWWAAAASVLECPWFCWQEYKIEMPQRSTTRKSHKEYKWLTERSLFSQKGRPVCGRSKSVPRDIFDISSVQLLKVSEQFIRICRRSGEVRSRHSFPNCWYF